MSRPELGALLEDASEHLSERDFVALSAGAVALVPLPAFLYWLGPRIDALAPRRLQQPPSGGRWGRLAAWVMRRPGSGSGSAPRRLRRTSCRR